MAHRCLITFCPLVLGMFLCANADLAAQPDSSSSRAEVETAMRRAATFYRTRVSSHGGYVYHYSLDLSQRWGEGEATADQIWVQPPGTPTVGLAFLKAFAATGDRFYLDAAEAAAEALVYGQVRSGGWTNCIDFNPRGERVSLYRNGKGRGRNTSSFDDGQTGAALLFLIRFDQATQFRHKEVHESAAVALGAILKVQFPNGAFPQVWDDDVNPAPKPLKASYPDYDWRTEGRIKNYWDMYTLNDNVPGSIAETLIAAHEVYKDEKYLTALRRLGDFLLLAQMPEPQPGWAQQYSYEMKPIWARKFEPPGVSGDETQEVIETLVRIASVTSDKKYLEPIPRALDWLARSLLPGDQLARYYELRTNKPLYMERNGKAYSLTHDDSRLPSHYGWKTESRVGELRRLYAQAQSGPAEPTQPSGQSLASLRTKADRIIAALDKQDRWVSTFDGERLIGQMKLPVGTQYLSSEVFSQNLEQLSETLLAMPGR